MNRTKLKLYAPQARREFIQAVTDRSAVYGLTAEKTEPITERGDVAINAGRAFPRSVVAKRRALAERIRQNGFGQTMEAMAYTWFNRLVAIRFMEIHGYLEHGYRVLSNPNPEKTIPEILEHAEHIDLPGLDRNKVIDLKLSGTQEHELYRMLLIAQCNALHSAMPFLFERIDDETELLLPDNLLHSDSLIRKLVTEIEEQDWQEVEIIGWLYQFYISEKKDEVIGKVVKSEDIPAATQLFTPNWIVKYLVQNTIGRKWLATYPDSPLRQKMEYYIEPAEQTDEVMAQLAAITPTNLDPEKLTLLDDACGSGHILVEAYELFKAIYQERGYRSKDIPRLILEKNLFGLEIDDRAAQLAAFALLMKARADDRGIFATKIQPNVLAIQESKGLEELIPQVDPKDDRAEEILLTDNSLFPNTRIQLPLKTPLPKSLLAPIEPCLRELVKLFEHGKTFGSLIRVPPALAAQLPAARQCIEAMTAKGQLWEHRAATLLSPLVRQAELLARTYSAVVANPPYMGSGAMNETLSEFIESNLPEGKADTYAAFILRNLEFTAATGLVGMITIPNWMFLSSFEKLRMVLLRTTTVYSLIHCGRGIWGSDFGSCAFTLSRSNHPQFRGDFRRLFHKQGEVQAVEEIRDNFFNRGLFGSYRVAAQEFQRISGSPFAYWLGNYAIFDLPLLSCRVVSGGRIKTHDGVRFIRFHWEVARSGTRWRLFLKGGDFRKYYGNEIHVVDWSPQSVAFYDSHGGLIREEFRGKEGICWSKITVATPSFRIKRSQCEYDSASPTIFTPDYRCDMALLGFLNSRVAIHVLGALNPTVNTQVADVLALPWRVLDGETNRTVVALAEKALALALSDWDGYEKSWDFAESPLLRDGKGCGRLGVAWEKHREHCSTCVEEMKTVEEEISRIFIAEYGLQSELRAEIPEDQITLSRPDREKDMGRLISYAIGCMMGRYSLDEPGLVYANSRNEGFDPSKYPTFPADADGIIPITEFAWFSDDATERFVEFIGKAWPREHLEENLRFIANSLGPSGDEHPRDTIRRYLASGFYKDHLQTYKKRPIYWLFSSGKQKAFQCLVYLHRYHEGTLARMRTEYVIPLQGKVNARIDQLASDAEKAPSTSHRKKLEKERDKLVKQHAELQQFDEKLRHYADLRISLDLDDGVKVNYGKFGDLLAEVKAVTGGSDE